MGEKNFLLASSKFCWQQLVDPGRESRAWLRQASSVQQGRRTTDPDWDYDDR